MAFGLYVYLILYYSLTCDFWLPGVIKNDVSFWNLFLSRNFTNGPIWFLSSLFFCLVILKGINVCSKEWLRFVLVFALGSMGYYWNYIFDFRLPLFWDTGLTALTYLYLGKWIKVVMNKVNGRTTCLVLSAVLAIWLFLFPQGCSMQGNTYPTNMLTFLVSSIAGSLSLIFLAKAIKHNALFQYIGCHSLIVLCFHMFVVMGVAFVMNKTAIYPHIAIWICFLMVMVISVAIIPIVKKLLKFVF